MEDYASPVPGPDSSSTKALADQARAAAKRAEDLALALHAQARQLTQAQFCQAAAKLMLSPQAKKFVGLSLTWDQRSFAGFTLAPMEPDDDDGPREARWKPSSKELDQIAGEIFHDCFGKQSPFGRHGYWTGWASIPKASAADIAIALDWDYLAPALRAADQAAALGKSSRKASPAARKPKNPSL